MPRARTSAPAAPKRTIADNTAAKAPKTIREHAERKVREAKLAVGHAKRKVKAAGTAAKTHVRLSPKSHHRPIVILALEDFF